MSVTVMSKVFYAEGLTPSQKLVMLALADHANDEGRSAYPAVARLVIKTALSERTVQDVLKSLRELQIIEIISPAAQHKPNEYAINLQKLDTLQHPGVQSSHPATSRGAVSNTPGVQSTAPRGATVAPESSLTINKPPSTPLTAGQKKFLTMFGAKRFKTTVQRDTIAELERKHGTVRLEEVATWAAKNGMNMGHAVVAIETALSKNNGVRPGTETPPDIPRPSLICGDGERLYRRAASASGQRNYQATLQDYLSHLRSCRICSGGSNVNEIQNEIASLASQLTMRKPSG